MPVPGPRPPWSRTPALVAAAALLALMGLAFRVAPLADDGDRLRRQFPTEDGYYMLTIARNLALGRGPSIAAGTIATDGTQPLMTAVWAACFAAAGGDRHAGLLLVQIVEIAVGALGALLLLLLGRRVLPPHPARAAVAALAAAAWFASPVALPHTMNGLETGAYAAVVTAALLVLGAAPPPGGARRPWGAGRDAALGLLLGAAFWIRNDAVFLALACCATVAVLGPPGRDAPGPWPERARHAGLMGGVAGAVAAPWVAYCTVVFGHPVPVSGRAEALVVAPWTNLAHAPAAAVETACSLVSIPHHLRTHPVVVIGCLALLAPLPAALAGAFRRGSAAQRRVLLTGAIFGLLLASFYLLFFGAPWFLGRFWFPLAGPALVAWGGAVLWVARTRPRPLRPALLSAAVTAAMGLATAGVALQLARGYQRGTAHPHIQCVRWVEDHLRDDVWVGATQSGMLGFFHDRTVNLGKVNPAAFRAIRSGTAGAYVADGPIDYIVDWTDAAYWLTLPEVAATFEVLVRDDAADLLVLRRAAPSRGPEEVHLPPR